MTIALVDSAAAAGTDGGWLEFTNMAGPCSMQGWPDLIAISPDDSVTAAKHTDVGLLTFPNITSPPLVDLPRGGSAFAAFAGSDTQAGSPTCPPSYRSLRVAPPSDSKSVLISAWLPYFSGYLPACVGVDVTFVIPAAAHQ